VEHRPVGARTCTSGGKALCGCIGSPGQLVFIHAFTPGDSSYSLSMQRLLDQRIILLIAHIRDIKFYESEGVDSLFVVDSDIQSE
jgi:hypothetical protein